MPSSSSPARLVVLSLFILFSASGAGLAQQAQPASDYFTVKDVARGAWALIAKPASPSLAVSNAAVIELGDKVLVVDSHLTPSAAREAARLIAALTGNKPVRYLVNTHWHPDHVQGNSTYSSSFPGALDIIAHANTRRDIGSIVTPFLKDQKARIPAQLERVKEDLRTGRREGQVLNEQQRRRLEGEVAQGEALIREIKSLELSLPTLTLDRSMVLHAGDREVQLLYFGRGHTEGDIVVFLPREKLLVTGDLLTNSIPFMRDAFPLEWSATLAGVESLDYARNIPGHGDVQQGKERLQMLRAFLDDLVPAVRRAIAEGRSVEESKRLLKAELAPKHEKNFPSWNGGAEASIERAFNQLVVSLRK
jgi:cyclase